MGLLDNQASQSEALGSAEKDHLKKWESSRTAGEGLGGEERGTPGLECNTGEKKKYVGEAASGRQPVLTSGLHLHTHTQKKQIIEFYKSLYF